MEIDREPVKSTSIASVGYDDLSATLEIEFRKASVYQYYDVPQRIYTELITASALGRFINNKVKPYFAYKKIPERIIEEGKERNSRFERGKRTRTKWL